MKVCSIEGCGKEFEARGLCRNHYMNYYHSKRRKIVINYYSNGTNKCDCCSESIYEFLTIDHINNDGAEHRRKIGIIEGSLIEWLYTHKLPDGFKVMCFNCNCGRAHTKDNICPHKMVNL